MKVKLRIKGSGQDIEGFTKLLRRIVEIEAQTPIIPNTPEEGFHRFIDVYFVEAGQREPV